MDDNSIDKSDYTRDTRADAPPSTAPMPPASTAKGHSGLLLVLLAFLPGLGHMYLGFIRRGLFYLSAFAFAIFVTVQFGIMSFVPFILLAAFGIVAVVAIAFFESLVIRRDLAAGKELEDVLPPFAKNRKTLMLVGVFLLVPFVINLLTTLSWYAWLVFALVFVVAVGYFAKKPK